MSKLIAWVTLAGCIFCGVNWFILPTFPEWAQYIPRLTMLASFGVAGIVIAISLCFGKD